MSSPATARSGRTVPIRQKISKLSLERVIGSSVFHNGSFNIDAKSGELSYAAGCVAISYDPHSSTQTRFLATVPANSGKLKPITSIAYAPNGKRMATAESGHNASIYVWNLENNMVSHELKSHTLGIAMLKFMGDSKRLISVGTEHDQQLNVWDLKSSAPLRGCKITSKIHAISVSEDGSFFVTVGLRHCRIWNLDLSGHTITCGSYKDHEFIDVICGTGPYANHVYAVSREGTLFAIDPKTRSLALHLDLKAPANALTLVGNYIMVACARGIVRVFRLPNLEYVASLPKPNSIGREFATAQEAACSSQPTLRDSGPPGVFPDTVAIQAFPDHKRVACFYNNRACFIWDISDLKQVGKYRSFLAHSACIWDIAMIPPSAPNLPPSSFATCSADGSIRIWNTSTGGNNVYCKELLASLALVPAEEIYQGLVSAGPVDGLGGSIIGSASTTMGLPGGIRAICITSDGHEIASGDRSGNIRVHRLDNFRLVSLQEAHESEVLRLAFNDKSCSTPKEGLLLASGSRDRLIHVFSKTTPPTPAMSFKKANVSEDSVYQLINTMDDHSASITGLTFDDNGKALFSASADKSVIFRHVSADGQSIKRYQNMILHNVMLDVVKVPFKDCIVIAGQDRKIFVYDSATGALIRTIPTLSEADILKIELDPSGLLLATASQDRIVRLYNFATGELLATAAGHSELITGVRFSTSGSRLISVSGDGCIFIWTIASELVAAMKYKLKQMAHRDSLSRSSPQPSSTTSSAPNSSGSAKSTPKSAPRGSLSSPPVSGKKTSAHASVLLERIISPAFHPNWVHSTSPMTEASSSSPKGYWASRVGATKIAANSDYLKAHGELVLPASTSKSISEGESKMRKRLSAEPDSLKVVARTLSSSRPLSRNPSSATPSPSATDSSTPTEAIIYFPTDSTDSTDIGPVIRENMPDLSASSTSVHEDDTSSDPSKYFEELQQAEPMDFLHQQNFGNLNDSFIPTKSTNLGRKSISAKYFLKRPTAPSTPPSSQGEVSSNSTSPEAGQELDSDAARREKMARDVEKTKARLRELGYGNFGTKPSPAPKHARSALETLASATEKSSTDKPSLDKPPAEIPKSPTKPAPPSSPLAVSKSMGDLPSLLPPVDDDSSLNHIPTLDDSNHVDYEADDQEEPVFDDDAIGEGNPQAEGRPAFLESLMSGFDRTVELYRDLKESQQQDEMVLQLRSAFAEMKATLDILSSEDSMLAGMASDRTYELTGSTTLECTEASMLERYSELLVGMVKQKLGQK